MKGRRHKDHIYYMEGEPEHEPVKQHINFAGNTKEHHLFEYARISKAYEQTFKVWTPYTTEMRMEYQMDQHKIALIFEHDMSEEKANAMIKDYKDKLPEPEINPDLDQGLYLDFDIEEP